MPIYKLRFTAHKLLIPLMLALYSSISIAETGPAQSFVNDIVSKKPYIVQTEEGKYYFRDKQISDKELDDLLYSHPSSKSLANLSKRRYRRSNLISIPLILGGAAIVASTESDGNFADAMVRLIGSAVVVAGISVKISLSASGYNKYNLAIEAFNSNYEQ